MHTFRRRLNSASQASGQSSVPPMVYSLVQCMSALAECLACMCGALNRSWEVSPVRPWGHGPILTAKKNWIKEEEDTACICDAFRGLWKTQLIIFHSAQLLHIPV